jgi:AraC-like DNA-binding protein
MQLHYYLPEPMFKGYVCYPEWLGRYRDMPMHQLYRPKGVLKSYNLHLVFSGRGYVRTSKRTYGISEGTGFLYDKNSEQAYGTDPDQPWDVRWVHFFGRGIESILEGITIGEGWIFQFDRSGKLMSLMDTMFELCSPFSRDHEQQLSVLLYELLLDIRMHAKPLSASSVSSLEKDRILLTAEFIRNRCTEQLTLSDMASEAGYSPQHFSRTFHKIMGKPPVQYLNESRILVAKHLLVSTDRTVKEIALESGFRQSSYFIKLFQQYEELTPQRYREMNAMLPHRG